MVDLSRAEVRYLVVGGIACVLCGHVRATFDLDLLVDGEPGNLRRLIDVLAGFGEGHARHLRVGDFGDEEGAVRVIEEVPIDLYTRIGGRRYADLLPYRRVYRGDADIPYVGAEGLVLMKSGSPRGQDRIDVERLRELLERRAT